MSEQFTNPEEALIERLRRAPQPELPAETRDMIRARVLDALDHLPAPTPRPTLLRPVVVIVVVLVAAALITGGVLFVLSQQNQTVVSPTVPSEVTVTVPPTATIEPTLTVLPTTPVPAIVSSPIATGTVVSTISPMPVPTISVSTIIVVEGPVEHIDGNIITIYGIQVRIAPNDPILSSVSVGDVLHVEGGGQIGTNTTQIIIVTTIVVFVNVEENAGVNMNPSSGEVWRDDGNCSHAPPDWAPANGWRRRCEGKEKDKDKGDKQNKDDKNSKDD